MVKFDDYCEECGHDPEDCRCCACCDGGHVEDQDEETSLETLANWQSEELRSM
ncbi:hypothetical protein [Exiguobacterium sp. KRL4]|uniref:hypothetical protein n=1 Tax=Exiguobacterium sp. KRL4 TaxID=1914536 RepID=UPI001373679F|nr:hypothetical protein [Exiguobacterium sp. KRL4]